MGYTHYWRPQTDIELEAWSRIKADAEKLIERSPVKLAYEEADDRPPMVTDDVIRFNALDEDEAHETFLLNRIKVDDFEFCKTAYKTYDRVVCGILASVAEHAANAIEISSDGDTEDWHEPLAWASEVVGRPLKNPCRKCAD